jgi:hypothetical protein
LGRNCACGCVPNIDSLFEMAKKRAEYREKLKIQQMAENDS